MSKSTTILCGHIYKNQNEEICSSCGKPTHEVDWAEVARLHRKWVADGKAVYQGWVSI
jgi:rRNA maturation endonuclease Nob1